MKKLLKEWHLIFFILIPLAYLGYIYQSLPDVVPIHWNLQGEVDGYGNKSTLLILAFLPLFFLFLFLLIQKVDPRKKLDGMGKKYDKLRNSLIVLVSVLVLYIFYTAQYPEQFSLNLVIAIGGLLYVVIGNYMKTVRANYFVGIRTPWTLESEEVWKRTHHLAGRLWFIGGIIIVLYCLMGTKIYSFNLFIVITLLIVLIPIIHSYVQFKKLHKS